MKRTMTSIVLIMIPLSVGGGDVDSPPETSSIRPADPPSRQVREEMVRWRLVYRKELAPVRKQWSRVVETMRAGRISDLPPVCAEFRDSVARLDRQRLNIVVDPMVRTWIGRGLVLLDGAASQCRRDRFFDLGFRLYKARQVIQSIDQRLERYR